MRHKPKPVIKVSLKQVANANYNYWKCFYSGTFILGLISMAAQISIFHKTIITAAILWLIVVLAGLIAFFLNRKHYQQVYLTKNVIWLLTYNICSWGFLCCYIFTAANYYLADRQSKEMLYTIIERGSLPGGKGHRDERQPTVIINYNGFEKELVFLYEDAKSVNMANGVKLSKSTDLFGFDVIEHYEAIQ